MNKYNHWLGKLFLKLFGDSDMTWYALTWRGITYWSCDKNHPIPNIAKVILHERKHALDQIRDGTLKFLIRYVFQWITKGYSRIDCEVEARAAELE